VTPFNLTAREQEVMRLICSEGQGSSKVVARLLGISNKTVEIHVANAIEKLGARTRLHAALIWDRAQREGGQA